LYFLSYFLNLVNIGQNHPGNDNATPQSTSSQSTGTNVTQQSIPTTNNVPGVAAGGLDFSNIARSIGTMVQGMAGHFIPGATLVNPNPTTSTSSSTSSTIPSSQNSNNTAATNNPETDTVTEQMLTGRIIFAKSIFSNSFL
jgi:hypothetical protein